MKVPPQVKDVVTFVFVKDAKGNLVPNGTGFFVLVKDAKIANRAFGYLVTAKHVLRDAAGAQLPEIFIRLNKKAGGSEQVRLLLAGADSLPVHVHDDEGVDLAVIPVFPSQQQFEFKTIPEEMLTTRERFDASKIGEGDNVFFVGLFVAFFGQQKNFPIVRFGRVAMLPGEPIPWRDRTGDPQRMLQLYLVESDSFGGNSGSPVFFFLDPSREPGTIVLGGPTLLLAGVVKGSFLEGRSIQVVDRAPTPVALENAGISAVVPAYYLNEILFSEKLKAARDAA